MVKIEKKSSGWRKYDEWGELQHLYVEDDKRFDTNDDDFMTKTSAYRKMLEEYKAVMKEEKEREKDIQTEPYVEAEVGGNVKNV